MNTQYTSKRSRPRWRALVLAEAVAAALLVGGPLVATGQTLDDGTTDIFRKNVSMTPDFASNKSKIAQIGAYTQAKTADGEVIAPVDGVCAAGTLIDGTCQVKPVVITYGDEVEEPSDGVIGNGNQEVFAAVSLDDGATWHRTNLSHSSTKSSITIDGVAIYGDTAKPVVQVNGRYVLVAWTGTYCPSGDPSNLGDAVDLYQVNGDQGIIDYVALGLPDLGLVPMSCVWTARGTVESDGDIVWLSAEQVTSARRDAFQLSVTGASQAGFGMIWQEDPIGLLPDSGLGVGGGMSGAVVSHKTDIWYSSLKWGDFLKTLEEVDEDSRPKVAVNWSSAVRISDNAACKVEADGSISGASYCELPEYCATVNAESFCVTQEGVALDGDTGASRANLILQSFTNPDGTVGAEAIIGYEETKGLGTGMVPDVDEDAEDIGKLVMYQQFSDFTAPDVIAAGTVLNHPSLDEDGNPLLAEDGSLLYENARRVRFISQAKEEAGRSGTVLLAVWKQGPEGKGKPSDILTRRALGDYSADSFVCTKWYLDAASTQGGSSRVCLQGALNMSSPTVLAVDETLVDDGVVRVIDYEWTRDNLDDATTANEYDDARAQRGILQGDFLAIAFAWTANYAAALNGNDEYNLYLRRSFDGGQIWTNLHHQFEEPVNLSNLMHGLGETVLEPRIVATPNTVDSGLAEDVQNPMVYYVTYGTTTNVDTNVLDEEEQVLSTPLDLYWSYTTDYGESYRLVEIGQDDNVRLGFDWLSAIAGVEESEAQVRVTPAGNKMYASWLAEGELDGPCAPGAGGGSDICMRKIEVADPLADYDVDGDGDLDLGDVTSVQAAVRCQTMGGDGCGASADVSGDGVVDFVDLKLVGAAAKVYQAQKAAAK
jgi:hypothetical protein